MRKLVSSRRASRVFSTVAGAVLFAGILSGCAPSQQAAAPSQQASAPNQNNNEPAPTETYTPPPAPILSGIIAVAGLGLVSNSVGVNEINPTTGAAQEWSSFTTLTGGDGPVSLETDAVTDYGLTPVAVASLFSSDFKKMTAAQADSSGHVNLGWETSRGGFTNITGPLWSAGTFASVPTFRNPQFAADGNYYFTSDINNCVNCVTGTFMSTSATAPSTPTKVAGGATGARWYWMNPDGFVTSMDAGGYFYQENVTTGIGTTRADSWVDAQRWLGVDSGRSQVWLSTYLAKPASYNVMDWGTSGKALTPEVSGYIVWSPVVSPDMQTVAFLAQQGGVVSVFTVPIIGGTPTQLKLNGGVPLDSSSVLAGWK